MKELILDRIESLKSYHNGFSKGTMRWRNYEIKNTHISVFEFGNLTDGELLEEFERIIRQHNKQM
jgi:hypothetical protein